MLVDSHLGGERGMAGGLLLPLPLYLIGCLLIPKSDFQRAQESQSLCYELRHFTDNVIKPCSVCNWSEALLRPVSYHTVLYISMHLQ